MFHIGRFKQRCRNSKTHCYSEKRTYPPAAGASERWSSASLRAPLDDNAGGLAESSFREAAAENLPVLRRMISAFTRSELSMSKGMRRSAHSGLDCWI